MRDPQDFITRPIPQATRLRFASNNRIYHACLVEDLFDQWMVIQSWGGKGSLRGGGQITHVENYEAGFEMLNAITRRREKHGYKPV